MANLNKVFLIGRLTHDPELRYTPGGAAVTDLRLAVNRTVPSRDGEAREETLFIDVTVWSRQAETCCQYLKKGRQVHVEGFLRMETWEDKATGQQRSKVKAQAENVQFLDSGGRRDEGAGPMGEEEMAAPPPPRENRRGSGAGGPPHAGGRPFGGNAPAGAAPRQAAPPPDEGEDDIPF